MTPIVQDGRHQRPAVRPGMIDTDFSTVPPKPVNISDFTLTTTDPTKNIFHLR